MQMSLDPGSHDPDPGPQEKSTEKSYVSFETECSAQTGACFKALEKFYAMGLSSE